MRLQDYESTRNLLQRQQNIFDQNVYRQAIDLLERLNQFVDKHKIQCNYGLALPDKDQPAARLATAGIQVGNVKMPTTLIKFLQSKNPDAKTMNQMFGMLLKHQKFNAIKAGRQLRVRLETE